MAEENFITLPWRFGGTIRDSINEYRKKNNLPEPEEVKKLGPYRIRDTFLKEELGLVRELYIDESSLDYVDLFPNVTSITFNGFGVKSEDFRNILAKYPNLENLTIKCQDNISALDLSNLKKLQKLELISNNRLGSVLGLEELKALKEFTFYDNIVFHQEGKLCNFADNLLQKGAKCNLDVLYMPTMQKLGIDISNANWCESIGLGIIADKIQYTTSEIEPAVKKAKEVVAEYITEQDTDMQKFAIMYHWMCKNIKYDYGALESKNTRQVNGQRIGKTGGANGTANGLIYGHCVCEGYSKSMQMLLKLCNIPSFDISCVVEEKDLPSMNFDGKRRVHEGDHSILKVNIDGSCYYSDVTNDASRYQNNMKRNAFLLSKEDMSKRNVLVGEAGVLAAAKSISEEDFDKLMAFAEDRIIKVEHIKAVKEVEELLDVNIMQRIDYTYDNDLGVPRVIPTNASTLSKEEGEIHTRLETLYQNGDLDLKKYHRLNLEILKEYKSQISSLPKNVNDDTSFGSQEAPKKPNM